MSPRVLSVEVQVTEEILQRVLQVMISDRSVAIRKALLMALDERLDIYLSRAHHIRVCMRFARRVWVGR